ncbi:hypothetical protein AB0M50_28295 [Nonomuraea fuscirosea]
MGKWPASGKGRWIVSTCSNRSTIGSRRRLTSPYLGPVTSGQGSDPHSIP